MKIEDLQPFNNSKSLLIDDGRSDSRARAGLKALLSINEDLSNLHKHAYTLNSWHLIEESIDKLDMVEFSEAMFEAVVEKPNVSIDKGNPGLVTLSLRPNLVHHAGI